MDYQGSKLIMRDYPMISWLIGIVLMALGIYLLPSVLSDVTLFGIACVVVAIAGGLALILFASILTVTADRTTQVLTLRYRSPVKNNIKEISFSNVEAVQLEVSSSRSSSRSGGNGPTYRIVVVQKDGESIPFHSVYTSGILGKMSKVKKLRSFLGVGGAEPGIAGMFQMAKQMAQPANVQQQESLTGSEAEEHVTDGVHWKLQTVTFGAQPITRWFSSDFRIADSFLYLTQKAAGQSWSTNGLLSGISKLLLQQSLSVYGYGAEDTPNLAGAEVMAPLMDRALDANFIAFTSDINTAREILNAWAISPLTDWASRFPLKTIQSNPIFGQLAVMFSPQGVYVSCMGTMIPEAVDELAALGSALVKSQGSSSTRA